MYRNVHLRYAPILTVDPRGYQWLIANVSTSKVIRKEKQVRKPKNKLPLKTIWLVICLIGLTIHSSFVIDTFLHYDVATETVIETPKDVRPPATSVCFLLWHLLKKESFELDHPCQGNLKKKAFIAQCIEELVKSSLNEILAMTYSPIQYLNFFELREVSNAWSTYKVTNQSRKNGSLQEYYNGPYRCIRFETSTNNNNNLLQRLSVSNLTKGYPKARYFLNASFDVSPNITPQITTVRVYVHEQDTFPRGAITLPAILNITREQLFIVSYRKVETIFLPKPFKFNCINYDEIKTFESHKHCVDDCIIKKSNTFPFTSVIDNFDRNYKLTTQSDSKEEEVFCYDNCPIDCTARTYYTMLADSNDEEETLTIITRFQEPETFVRYIPKLDLQSFIIYEAGILSIWFSASIYFTLNDLFLYVFSTVKKIL